MEATERIAGNEESYRESLVLNGSDSIDFQPIPLPGDSIPVEEGDLPVLAEVESGEKRFVIGDRRNYLQASDKEPTPFAVYKVAADNEGNKHYEKVGDIGTSLATSEVKIGGAIASNIGAFMRLAHASDSEESITVSVAKTGIMIPTA